VGTPRRPGRERLIGPNQDRDLHPAGASTLAPLEHEVRSCGEAARPILACMGHSGFCATRMHIWASCADISSWPVGRSAQRLDLPEVAMSDPLEGLSAEARMGSSAPR
jgi:hypothetical protein